MSAYKVQSDDCQVILFFANADGRLTICIRRPPPHFTSTVQRAATHGPGSPHPHPPGGRNGRAAAPGEGPPSLAASDEPAAVQAHPRCPSPAARGSESRLKDFAHPSPPGPNPRHPWEAEGASTHDSPPLLAAKAHRLMHNGWLRSDFHPNRSLHHPVLGSPPAHALQAHAHRRPTSRRTLSTKVRHADRVRPLPLP